MGAASAFLLPALLPLTARAQAPSPCRGIASPRDGFVLVSPQRRILEGQNLDVAFIPASTLKLLTGLMAIERLGPGFRFHTRLYLDSKGNLKIKGYGDPLLISEVWASLAKRVASRRKEFRGLLLDATFFAPGIVIPGRGCSTNPYDAPVGALCANFNTVFFSTDSSGRLVSAEPQTPLLPTVEARIRALGLRKGRITFSHRPKEATLYAGELFMYFASRAGIRFSAPPSLGRVGPEDRLFLDFASPFPLTEVVRRMLAFSNNFVANQLFLAMGAQVEGAPATLEKSRRVASRYLADRLGLKGSGRVVEGSGISRENRLSPLAMIRTLDRFLPYHHLLTREGVTLFKTGSLRGIRTRAGYIKGPEADLFPFAVFLQHDPGAMDRLLDCLIRRTRTLSPTS